jgi:hypothetical protein
MIPGIEIPSAPARRAKRSPKPIVIQTSAAERLFVLARIANITATVEAILHHPPPSHHLSPWTREQVVRRVVTFVDVCRINRPNLFIISPLDRAVITNAIEANPYFAQMADGDPRLTVAAVRLAEAFRARVARALKQQIHRVPLGAGRRRIE